MRQDDLTVVAAAAIRRARSSDDLESARNLFVEYARSIKIDLCFQDFEHELATLPGAYAPPDGRLLLAGGPEGDFGCIALRPLAAGCGCGSPSMASSGATGEVKRLYVQPTRRGEGWGERLARRILAEGRVIGYRELKLDTLAWMSEARALYARLGFRECAPYYDNPLPGVVYMALALPAEGENSA
jgi:GNAT superfamily N-acetyltransferase